MFEQNVDAEVFLTHEKYVDNVRSSSWFSCELTLYLQCSRHLTTKNNRVPIASSDAEICLAAKWCVFWELATTQTYFWVFLVYNPSIGRPSELPSETPGLVPQRRFNIRSLNRLKLLDVIFGRPVGKDLFPVRWLRVWIGFKPPASIDFRSTFGVMALTLGILGLTFRARPGPSFQGWCLCFGWSKCRLWGSQVLQKPCSWQILFFLFDLCVLPYYLRPFREDCLFFGGAS